MRQHKNKMAEEQAAEDAKLLAEAEELAKLTSKAKRKVQNKPTKKNTVKLSRRMLQLLRSGIGSDVLAASSVVGSTGGRSKLCLELHTGLISRHLRESAGETLIAVVEASLGSNATINPKTAAKSAPQSPSKNSQKSAKKKAAAAAAPLMSFEDRQKMEATVRGCVAVVSNESNLAAGEVLSIVK